MSRYASCSKCGARLHDGMCYTCGGFGEKKRGCTCVFWRTWIGTTMGKHKDDPNCPVCHPQPVSESVIAS